MKNSTSEILPRGGMSAYQRWELASLAGSGAQLPLRDDAARAAEEDAAALERVVVEARERGFAQGLAAAHAERARLSALLERFEANAADHEQRLADEVLDLALVLGRQLVGEALAVRRELVLPVVSAALQQLPQSTQRVELVLNPGDLERVRLFLASDTGARRCHLVPSPAVAPGGCRVETEQCDLDATLPTRWRRLLAELGRSDGWLEPT